MIAADIGTGAAAGFTSAKAGGADAQEALKATALGASIGAVAPPVLGGAIKLGGLAAGAGSRQLGRATSSLAQAAEKRASMLDNIARDTYQSTDIRKAQRAKTLSGIAGAVQRTPGTLRTGFFEPFAPLEEPEKVFKRLTGKDADFKKIAENVPSAAGARSGQLTKKYIGILSQAGKKDIANVVKYADTLNKIDRLKLGQKVEGGASQLDLQKKLSTVFRGKTTVEVSAIKNLQREWQGIMQEVLDDALDSGNISKQQFDAFRASHPNYLPNVVEDFLNAPSKFIREAGLQAKEIHGAKGSVRKLQDPITSTVEHIQRWSLRAQQNRAAREIFDKFDEAGLGELGIERVKGLQDIKDKKELISLLKESKSLKSLLTKKVSNLQRQFRKKTVERRRLEKVGKGESLRPKKERKGVVYHDTQLRKYIDAWLVDPSARSPKLKKIQKSIGLRDDQISLIERELTPIREALIALNKERKGAFLELQILTKQTTPDKTIDLWKEGKETFTFRRDGEDITYEVPIELGHALKNLDPNDITLLGQFMDSVAGKALKFPADVLRGAATKYNINFALIRNPIRDVQNARITSNVAMRDFAWTASGAIANVLAPNSDFALRYARAMEKAQLSGGIIGAGFFGKEKTAASIVSKALDDGNILSKVARHPLRTIEDLGGFFENNTRLAVFVSELRQGSTARNAADMARNATADFSKAGRYTKELNKVIPYLNARIRGVDALGRAFKNDPVGTVRKSMYNAAYPAIVLNRMNSQYESYQNIPSWEKKSYWIIMTGEMAGKTASGDPIMIPLYIKVPKGEAQQIVASITDRMLDTQPESSTGEFIIELAGSVSPVSLDQGLIPSLLPTGIKVPIELSTNYSFFKKKAIIPDFVPVEELGKTRRREELVPGRQVDYNTSEISRELGKLLNISPAKIDHTIRIGALRDVFDAADIVLDKDRTPGALPVGDSRIFDMSTKPGVRTFFGSSYYGQYLNDKERELLEAMEKVEAEIDAAIQKESQATPSEIPTSSGTGLRFNPSTGRFE